MEKFRRLNPPIFKGDGRPTEVEGWIREMEKIFQVIQCTNEEKVSLATYMLQARADVWWQATKRNIFAGQDNIGWEEFLREFQRKFFSDFDHNRLEMEFLQLQQAGMTVAQYEVRFSELVNFSPFYRDDEQKKAMRFVQGLRGPIRDRVSLFEHNTVAAAYRVACIAESNVDSMVKTLHGRTGRAPPTKMMRRNPDSRPAANFKPNDEGPRCQFCQRRHTGECLKSAGKCFRCGGIGHFIKDCPRKPGEPGRKAPARVYHLSN